MPRRKYRVSFVSTELKPGRALEGWTEPGEGVEGNRFLLGMETP